MNSRLRTAAVLLLAVGAGGCQDRGALAPPPSAVTVHPIAHEGIPGLDLIADFGMSLLEKYMESSGLFEAIGLGPDPYTKEKFDEIISQLDRLSDQVGALQGQIDELQNAVEIQAGQVAITDAYTKIVQTCYRDTLRATASSPDMPVTIRNDALLARAYQILGEPVPSELGSIDDNCSIFAPLNDLLAYVDPAEASGIAPPFFPTVAKVARSQGIPFAEVAKYFVRVVGIQRQAMALLAQAHHRVGQDSGLATLEARTRDSLRRQEIELLRAAEAYVAYQGVGSSFDGSPLELSDLVVARMEGNTGLVSEALILVQPWQDPSSTLASLRPAPAMPTVAELESPIPLDDQLAADGGYTGYGVQQPAEVSHSNTSDSPYPYPYVVQLTAANGFEIGDGKTISIIRWRTTQVAPRSPIALLHSPSAPVPDRTISLQGLNAASLETEWSDAPSQASNLLDRQLLAHENADESPMSRLQIVPSADDPRRVILATDEPSRGLSSVAIGASGDGFAARPELAPVVLEMVPAGPDTPDRYAFRLDDGSWLAVASSGSAGGAFPVGASSQQPSSWFDVLPAPSGDGYQVSYVDASAVRRFLYVNEEIVVGFDWQVVPRSPAQVVLQIPWNDGYFDVSTPMYNGSLASPVQAGLSCPAQNCNWCGSYSCWIGGNLAFDSSPGGSSGSFSVPAGFSGVLECLGDSSLHFLDVPTRAVTVYPN